MQYCSQRTASPSLSLVCTDAGTHAKLRQGRNTIRPECVGDVCCPCPLMVCSISENVRRDSSPVSGAVDTGGPCQERRASFQRDRCTLPPAQLADDSDRWRAGWPFQKPRSPLQTLLFKMCQCSRSMPNKVGTKESSRLNICTLQLVHVVTLQRKPLTNTQCQALCHASLSPLHQMASVGRKHQLLVQDNAPILVFVHIGQFCPTQNKRCW